MDEGTYAKIIVEASTSLSSSSITISSVSCAIRKPGASTDTYTNNDMDQVTGHTGQYAAQTGDVLNTEDSYNVSITVTDSNGATATTSTYISSTLYTIHRMAGGQGVAFGTASNKYGVEIEESWPFYTHNKEIQELIMDIAHPVNSAIETLNSSFNPNTLWPWTQWGKLNVQSVSGAHTSIQLIVWVRIR